MDYLDFQRLNRTLENLCVFNWSGGGATLVRGGQAIRLAAVWASHTFFPTLGRAPLLGRFFTAEEDRPGNEFFTVLSYGLWQREFASDPEIVGKSLTLSGRSYRVLGVMAPSFYHPERSERQPDLWFPLAIDPAQDNRGGHYLNSIGRLAQGVTLQQAQADMARIAERLAELHPDEDLDRGVRLEGLHQATLGNTRHSLPILIAAVSLLFLIACSNVVHLFLVRTLERKQEMGVRVSLGGHGPQLFFLFIGESLVLAFVGSLGGLLLGYLLETSLLRWIPDVLPLSENIQFNYRVVLFASLCTLLTCLIMGLWPALSATRTDPVSSLRHSSRSISMSKRSLRHRQALVILETILAVVLLTATTLLVENFLSLERVDEGIRREKLFSFQVNLAGADYPEPYQQANFYEELRAELEAEPAIRAAAVVDYVPLSVGYSCDGFQLDDRAPFPPGQGFCAEYRRISDDYFQILGIELLEGREFDRSDRGDGPPVIIIDQELKERFWPEQSPIGKQMTIHRQSRRIVLPGLPVCSPLAELPRSTLVAFSEMSETKLRLSLPPSRAA